MSSLETSSEKFLNWYLTTLIRGHQRTVGRMDDLIYLPYSGNDAEFIFKLFRLFVKMKYPDFSIDESNSPVIKHLIKIVTDPEAKRGLIIRGAVGTGKTALILVWLEFRQIVLSAPGHRLVDLQHGLSERRLTIRDYTPTELISRVAKDGYSFFEHLNKSIVFFVDDIGLANTVTSYGTEINILEQLIYSRYDSFKYQPNLELYGTTNIASTPLKKAIGERAWSRLMEMVNWNGGLLSGDDRRSKNNQLKKWPTFLKSFNNLIW